MPTLYLDMNIYKRPFDDQRQMRIHLETVAITMIFALIDDGQLSARWSFVLDYENNRDPVQERREFVQYLSRCCKATIEPDESIRELALTLSETHQIRGRDALHLAISEISGCDYLVTCDDQLVRQGQRLKEQGVISVHLINPVDFVQEV
ncbi:MAG: PIN domain-containing protein [Anaerolineae bacterium]|nr:PIN domain-containing protein [Anaerolineae bacterium]